MLRITKKKKKTEPMLCSEGACLRTMAAVETNQYSFEELDTLLHKCFNCLISSGSPISKETSHAIDLKFAEMLVNFFGETEDDIKEFNLLLDMLKKDIAKLNCLNQKEEEEMHFLIQEAVKKGEIFLQKHSALKVLNSDNDEEN